MLLVVLLLVVAAVGGGVAAIAVKGKRTFAADNQVVPGQATAAAADWAGAHTPEALLHRRLRDAVRAVRAQPAAGLDAARIEAQVSIEQQALSVDERLIGVAALPDAARAERLPEITTAVAAVEAAVAALVDASAAAGGQSRVDQAIADVNERVALLDQARAELTATDRPATDPPATAAEPSPGD